MKLCFNEKYFREYKRSKNSVHEPIPATYQTFQGDDGRKYFQLDTYSKSVVYARVTDTIGVNYPADDHTGRSAGKKTLKMSMYLKKFHIVDMAWRFYYKVIQSNEDYNIDIDCFLAVQYGR